MSGLQMSVDRRIDAEDGWYASHDEHQPFPAQPQRWLFLTDELPPPKIGLTMFIVANIIGSSIQITTLPLPVLSTLQAVS